MPSIEHKWYRRFLFLFVYLIQTIITVVTLSLFPLLFQGILDPLVYGAAGSLSLLPMVFKAFIGPLSDNFPIPFLRGRRRGYIIIGLLLNLVTIPFLALNPVTFTVLFFTIWFLQTLGIATMDILVDALAVEGSDDLKKPKGRTGASLWMFLGIFLGGAVASGFSAGFEGHAIDPVFDMQVFTILCIVALLSIIPLILIFFLKEPVNPIGKKGTILQDIRQNLRHPFIRWGLIFAFMLNIDAGMLELTLEPYVQNLFGIGITAIVASLFFISLIGIITAFLGYLFIDRIKKNRLLAIIAGIYVAPSLVLGILTLFDSLALTDFLILYAIFGLISGLSYVTYISLFLELSDPKAAGTMLALFFSVTNGGIIIGLLIGGALTSIFGTILGVGIIYILTAVISGARILPLLKIRMDDIQKEFYPPPS